MRRVSAATAILIVLLTCEQTFSQVPGSDPAQPNSGSAAKASANPEVSEDLKGLFATLDDLGRSSVKDARLVELALSGVERSGKPQTMLVWLLSDNGKSITVLEDDLLPWTYSKNANTTIPANWNPATVKVESVRDADAEKWFKDLDEHNTQRARLPIFAAGPSRRALAAHAAWKKGMPQYCKAIVAPDLEGNPFAEYQRSVLDDLAWLQFLRGVNLLMFADRGEVVKNLRLVPKLSPKSEFAEQSKELADQLDKIIAEKNKKPETSPDETHMTDEQRASLYVSQLIDLRCMQFAQPGDILVYAGILDGKPSGSSPTAQLRDMQMSAVPTLLKALEDDRPTRSVYHWRDFLRVL